MLLYAITDRKMMPGDEANRQSSLVNLAVQWAVHGVDYLQIREKDLGPSALRALAVRIVQAVKETGKHTRVLLNGPAQIALESGCDGVHLPGGARPEAIAHARELYHAQEAQPIVSAACHGVEEVERLRSCSLLLFAPVFEKLLGEDKVLPGAGLERLQTVCRAAITTPVFALGGVTWKNAPQCTEAGAAGIAGIRLFLNMPQTDIPQNEPASGSKAKSR
jgi:thiamine-phosphate pyrophosphorylase